MSHQPLIRRKHVEHLLIYYIIIHLIMIPTAGSTIGGLVRNI